MYQAVSLASMQMSVLTIDRAQINFGALDSPGALSGRAERRDALVFPGGKCEGVAQRRPAGQRAFPLDLFAAGQKIELFCLH